MKTNTIKWRIFKYNIIAIVLLIALSTIIFNIAVRLYMERDISSQLQKIAARAEETALRKGSDFFVKPKKGMPPDSPALPFDDLDVKYYFMLDRSLKEPLSVLNAAFILLDEDKKIVTPYPEGLVDMQVEQSIQIIGSISKHVKRVDEKYIRFKLNGTDYVAIVKSVSDKNNFGLGWIVIYSSLQKLNQLQLVINMLLLLILVISALIILVLSSVLSKKISEPFSSLNEHIRALAERNFDAKLHMPVDDELQELVSNINTMSEKLESYDQAQKTFLQNASHEFRTPIMSIQSYAEGIKYDVVEKDAAVNIILDESKRLTSLVENLLYLSRLDSIEESYRFGKLDFNEFLAGCLERMKGIAIKNNIELQISELPVDHNVLVDEEKLCRAINNIVSNCLRYAVSHVQLSVTAVEDNHIRLVITDDGPGFEPHELPNIFHRFYKGKKGNFGLGLAISKNIIEKHHGKISAMNGETGAQFIIELPVV